MKQNEDAAPSILDDVWRDAMRYRFVRVADKVPISREAARDPIAYDEAIDRAMEAAEPKTPSPEDLAAIRAGDRRLMIEGDMADIEVWPWDESWWKPTTPRRDLVKAAALILAEIERLDRMAAAKQEGA